MWGGGGFCLQETPCPPCDRLLCEPACWKPATSWTSQLGMFQAANGYRCFWHRHHRPVGTQFFFLLERGNTIIYRGCSPKNGAWTSEYVSAIRGLGSIEKEREREESGHAPPLAHGPTFRRRVHWLTARANTWQRLNIPISARRIPLYFDVTHADRLLLATHRIS